MIKTVDFFREFVHIMDMEGQKRKSTLLTIHQDTLEEYLETLLRITPQEAGKPSSDGRSISQVVGHIMEWERFLIQAYGEILTGADWCQFMSFSGYVDLDGKTLSFETIDEFNAYQEEKHSAWAWDRMRSLATRTAETLYTLLSNDELFPAERLGQTRELTWNVPGGSQMKIPLGWFLWQIIIEHTAHHFELDLHRF